MIRIARQASTLLPLLAAASLLLATSAYSQAPTDAQRAAIKAQCRADYIAHCSSVPPGGAASLQCLQKNMAHLSGGCASAVNAVLAPAKAETKSAPKEETRQEAQPAPAAEPAKPATETAAEPAAKPVAKAATSAGKPSQAQLTAVRSACRFDYMAHCASIPPGGAASLQCLEKNKASLSPACGKAVAVIGGGAAAAGAAPATATAPAAAPTPRLALRPMRPREVLFVMRSACGRDVRALCPGVEPGGGRIAECLTANAASLSPACRGVLGQFAAR